LPPIIVANPLIAKRFGLDLGFEPILASRFGAPDASVTDRDQGNVQQGSDHDGAPK
jgi:hypothetical protein